jgi:hypothetical protein
MNKPTTPVSTRRRWPLAIAAWTLLAALPAWAASGGTSAFGPIGVQLIDLRPEDGIAPSISFQVEGMEAGVVASAGVLLPLNYELRAHYGPWQGTSIDAATPHSRSAAAVAGGGVGSPAGVAALLQGSADDYAGLPGSAAAFATEVAILVNGESIGFVLSPWTSVVLSMDFSTQLTTTKEDDTALTTAGLFVSDAAGLFPMEERFDRACAGACSVADRRTLSVTLSNGSGLGLDGYWWAAANLGGTSFASAVPEPAPLSLGLCGALVAGLVAARRTRVLPTGRR